jgi:hypothetical protein
MGALEAMTAEVQRQADNKLDEVIAMALSLQEPATEYWLMDEGSGP